MRKNTNEQSINTQTNKQTDEKKQTNKINKQNYTNEQTVRKTLNK